MVAAAMGVIRSDLGAAARLAIAARQLAGRLQDPYSIGTAERLHGHVHLLRGRSRPAVRHYQAAREAFQSMISDDDSARTVPLGEEETAATAVAMLQALAYTGEYERAFAVGEEAIRTFTKLGDTMRAARVRANLGNAYHRLDQLENARAQYEAAIPELTRHALVGDLAIVMRNFGVTLMAQQDFAAAERMYREARAVFEADGDTSLVLEVDLNYTYARGRQGYWQEAFRAYRRLTEVLPQELSFELGHALLDQSDFMLEAGLIRDAAEAASRAAAVFERLRARFELGKARLFQAVAALRQGNDDAAHRWLKEARQRLLREPNETWQALTYQTMAECAERRGEVLSALRALQRATEHSTAPERVAALRDQFAALALRTDPSRITPEVLEPCNAAVRAFAAVLAGDSELAAEYARQWLAEYDARRNALTNARLRQGVARAQERYLRLCLASLRHPADRLDVVQRIKNQALTDIALSPEGRAVPADASGDLSVARAAIQRTGEDDAAEATFLDRLQTIQRTADARLTTARPPIHFATDEAFLELFTDGDSVRGFWQTADGVVESEFASREEAAAVAARLRFHLARDPFGSGDSARPALRWLGDRLRGQLPPGVRRLWIGRDEPLAAVPFHAALDGDRWFMDEISIAYAPSASAWAAIRSRPRSRGTSAFVLGAPDALAPEIAREVREVAARLATEVHDEMRPADLESARMIHLAAHGIGREEQPLFTSLRLGSRDWSVIDVWPLRLRADLVTLSGCGTGVSAPTDTNDAEGFIEAFLAAGARTVLASLWSVADTVTRDWMVTFYEHRSLGTELAYRAACQTVRQRHPNPALWAPFALFGDL